MSRLIRMDASGHSTLAEWTAEDAAALDRARIAFETELAAGYVGVVDHGGGTASQVTELPAEADLVLLRRPIAGG